MSAIRIFGVPMDLGQRRRGVDMGPSALRYAGLQQRLSRIGLEVYDGGNVAVPVVEEISPDPDDGRAHNASAISKVCHEIHDLVRDSLDAGERVITLGGDHSIALGTVSAALMQPRKIGVLWIDAHGDFNTPETTPSGNVHGMVVSSLMGMSPDVLTIGDVRLKPEQIVQIGIRDLDAEEKVALGRSGIRVITMREIDEMGMATVVRTALATLGDVEALHVSLDMDSLDPKVAPGVGTPVPGGLTYREAHLLLEMLADDGRVRSLDIVEVNPILDDSNTTAKVAVELAASLFGSRILLAVREKPDIADEAIMDCLRADYGVAVAALEFLPLGYDTSASVYRIVGTDESAYFLKLKRGAVDELSLTIPQFLKTHGLEQVIAPLRTRTGRLRTQVEDFTVLLYPFIKGSSGKEIGLTDRQWIEFGTALKKLHSLELPTELATRIPGETFIPNTSPIKAVDAKIDAGDFNNRFAHELAAFWVEKRDEIHHLVERAETLGRQLQAQTHDLVLCHADIHTANVLIGTDSKLWIVDWDTPILAPKERDLIFVTGVGAGAALITSVPGAHGETLFYSGYGKTEIDPMALAYYRYDWALQDIGEFGASIFVAQGVGEETLEDAEYCLRVSFTPGSVAEAARQKDDWFWDFAT